MSKEFLRKAVDLAGGQVALAAGIKARMPAGTKVSQAHIWKWLNRVKSDVPPGDYVVPIADSIGYQITPHQLREDLYPNVTDALPADVAEKVLAGQWPVLQLETSPRAVAACEASSVRRSTDRQRRRRKGDVTAQPLPEERQAELSFNTSELIHGIARPDRRKGTA